MKAKWDWKTGDNTIITIDRDFTLIDVVVFQVDS